mgnify:FL=1
MAGLFPNVGQTLRGLGVAVLMGWLLVGTASAQSLDDAKTMGFVGETPTGYLDLVTVDAPAWVEPLMRDINLKRQNHYREIAAKNSTRLSLVEQIVAEELYKKLTAGEYFRDADGAWQQR